MFLVYVPESRTYKLWSYFCSQSNIGLTFEQPALLMFLFYRPGILKDLKTMGSISLFIFFITLLVLGRQVRHTVLFTSGHNASCHLLKETPLSCYLPYPCKGVSGASIKLIFFLPSNMPLKLTITITGIMLIVYCAYCLSF